MSFSSQGSSALFADSATSYMSKIATEADVTGNLLNLLNNELRPQFQTTNQNNNAG